MKLKSLLFGSAAIIAAGTGAQAADLPTAEPVEYVRICDAFGTGFYYIPGTDTCLKVGGQVRAEAHYVFESDDEFDVSDLLDDDDDDLDDLDIFDGFLANSDDPGFNNFTTRARGNVRLDARTQTDFGLIRAFIDLEMTVGPGDDFDNNYSSTSPSLAAAFVQITNDFGTFTAGHTGSFFDFFGSYGFGTRLDIDDNTTEQTLFAYTFGGGNGFSFTVSAEDPASSGRRYGNGGNSLFADDDDDVDFPSGLLFFAGDEFLGGQEFPDGVFNIRVDQGWGSAQIMGVVGQNHSLIDVDDDDDDIFEFDDGESALGWAVGAGISTKIPFLGGLEFSAQGGYSEGRLGYISVDRGGFGDFLGPDPEDTSTGWNVRAGVRANFSETVDAAISASYTHVEYEDETFDDIVFPDDDDDDINLEYDYFAIHGNVRWKPVEGLYMGPEVAYQTIDFGGFNDLIDSILDDDDDDDDDDIDLDDLDLDGDDDVFGVMFRLQRSF